MDVVALTIATPFLNHWYFNAPEPFPTTLKVAVDPEITITLSGWYMMEAATTPEITIGGELEVQPEKLQPVETVEIISLAPAAVLELLTIEQVEVFLLAGVNT